MRATRWRRNTQTRTKGTVTKGAVNVAQICANFANTVDLHPLVLPTNLANSRKSGQFRTNSANVVSFHNFWTYTPVSSTPVCSVPSVARRHGLRRFCRWRVSAAGCVPNSFVNSLVATISAVFLPSSPHFLGSSGERSTNLAKVMTDLPKQGILACAQSRWGLYTKQT